MEKSEQGPLATIPVQALSLTLTRSTIKMLHSPSWSIDKTNSVHDLIICLTGHAQYRIAGETILMEPGNAMLIPANTHFVGRSTSTELYTGIAQHFTLNVFGRMDMFSQMDIRRSIALPRWDMLEPMVRHYRETVPLSSTTLAQHHLFMVFLIEFIEAAFMGWREQQEATVDNPDALSMAVMVAASRIAADPLNDQIVADALSATPYNQDYFRRVFRRQVGLTPTKYQEFKRMERAMALLAAGRSVKETAALIGYSDSYYFSRMFKHYIGVSPAGYKAAERRHRDGHFPRGEEDGQVVYPVISKVKDADQSSENDAVPA
ncbi:helix-turn-helix domain-containing protein [Rhizobium oryzicola]|uniref:AraC family transcriptional regulator n=1 Tax=Rhizobium oryzicola TaxID=1232668 RepID=A0ABT8T2I7_9HYPH|nr:AraC family transcriptional regulator [Rhizobium oryzicola]MDO1584940.1 AraC family transcriptional regulator [Rhizobium oryzicola]